MPDSPAAQPDQVGDDLHLPRVAVLTVARDEAGMLPRWMDYYGQQVGIRNLVVLDDNSVDGSTDDLPCTVHHLPPAPWKQNFEQTRMKLVSGIGAALLACYDVVIFCDVDEFLVPDPDRHEGLREYLQDRAERHVIAPVGMNVLHNPAVEAPLDPSRPVLEQRRFVKFAPGMCKPAVKRIAAPWRAASHAITSKFEIDPELWLLHLKFYDVDTLKTVADHRHRLRKADGRALNTSWKRTGADLTTRLRTWTNPVPDDAATIDAGAEVPEFDPAENDLDQIIQQGKNGLFSTKGGHIGAMQNQPLRQLPARFRSAF